MASFLGGFIALAALLAGIWYAWGLVLNARYCNQRYRFFALRDRLYFMVADGKLDGNSKVFVFTQKILNTMIQESKNLDAIAYGQLLAFYKDPKPYKKVDALISEIKANPELVKLHLDIFACAMKAMAENSLLVFLFHHHAGQKNKRIMNMEPRARAPQQPAPKYTVSDFWAEIGTAMTQTIEKIDELFRPGYAFERRVVECSPSVKTYIGLETQMAKYNRRTKSAA